jgi:4-amino-4-deoxy-L-arabinose transferase-like glycosyltransferase
MAITYRYSISEWLDSYPLLILIIIAVVPRFIMLAFPAFFPQLATFGADIHDGYCQIAQNLVNHGIYSLDGVAPTFGRAPLYPLLLTPGALFGHIVLWGLLLNVALGVLACVFIFKTGILFKGSNKLSFILSLFLALNPWHIWMTKNGMTYVLTTFLLSIDYWLIGIIYAGNSRNFVYLILGIITGLTALSHPVNLVLIIGIIGAITIILSNINVIFNKIISYIVILTLGWIIVLIPWSMRNYYHTRSFIPIVSGFGYQYLLSAARINILLTKGILPWDKEGNIKDFITKMGEIPIDKLDRKFAVINNAHQNKQLDSMGLDHIMTNLNKNPLYFLKHMMVNFFFLLFGDINWGLVLLHIIYFVSIMSFIIIGIIKYRRYLEIIIIYTVILPTILVHCLMHAYIPHAAYSIPLSIGFILSAMVVWPENYTAEKVKY